MGRRKVTTKGRVMRPKMFEGVRIHIGNVKEPQRCRPCSGTGRLCRRCDLSPPNCGCKDCLLKSCQACLGTGFKEAR